MMTQKSRWIPIIVGVTLGTLWSSRGLAQSSALELSELRFAGAGAQRTLTLQFSQPPTAVQSFVLTSPTRLVIDVSGPVANVPPGTIPVQDVLLARVRTGIHDRRLRFVLDLQTRETPKFSVEQQQGVVTAILTAPGEQSSEQFSRVLFALPGQAAPAPSTPAAVVPPLVAPPTQEAKATAPAKTPVPPMAVSPKKPSPPEEKSGPAEKLAAPPSQTPQEHLERGQALYAKGEVDEAIVQWQETLRVAPETAKAHHLLGLALQHRGKVPEAITALQEAVRLTPHDAAAYIHLGQALEAKGDVEAARAAYQKAQQLVPTSAYIYDRLGHLSAAQEKWGETVYAWRETVRLRPQSAAAYANLGEALEKVGKQEEALAAYERALQLDPQKALAGGIRQRVTQLRTAVP